MCSQNKDIYLDIVLKATRISTKGLSRQMYQRPLAFHIGRPKEMCSWHITSWYHQHGVG